MEKKFLFIIFSIVLISISPQVFAQDDLDSLLAEKNAVLIEQQEIIFEVGKYSDVQVKHVIETGAWSENRPRVIEVISGAHSNLTVVDEDGDKLNFSYDAETFEESKYIILNQKLGNYDLIVEYTLDNFMELDYGLWTKELKSGSDITVMIEDDIELIFANSRPIDVSEAKGINCIGCNMVLEYFDTEKFSSKEIPFSNDKFTIDFLSNGKISEMEFIGGGAQLLNFDVISEDQLFVLKIPLEYLLNPFEVYFTENDDIDLDQVDKIRKTEFSQDETHVNVSFRTFGEGTVSIVGATPEEHQKKLDQIENIKAREVKNEVEEKEKGLALPIPGTKAASELAEKSGQMNEEEMVNKLSFADDLKKGQVENSEDNAMILAIIVGVIIAGIIGGVIFKLKKN
ncbi:hypothetical protein A7X95_04875 [Candidatus Nitrosopelagicus brevis]|uniref:Uncharacterized protein n=1 Tax=Candidatus Nitrosopelagicus brevis TaxID=1410606 RepID=A0A0A7V7L1_9ARCH|nr:hypothetical protein [Candidatus Nitrosopelagicus brevis]AJA92620.1 hypothetical protein T478_1455 [Candidatus Nitrosopelagicus brevis]NMI84092.1 hypothetical protein [Candidatus Nitrosopelagicus brevis]PTL87246.1 hypothetical protein A7X95_04875 [Candidatus Nitrosopelagicus brevis]